MSFPTERILISGRPNRKTKILALIRKFIFSWWLECTAYNLDTVFRLQHTYYCFTVDLENLIIIDAIYRMITMSNRLRKHL